ncbi:MAG: hypothetical protein QM704_14850 [Anaeromyxobacteraceae bacterium]
MPWPPRRRIAFIRRADHSIIAPAPPGYDAEGDGLLRDPLVRAMWRAQDRVRRERQARRDGIREELIAELLDEEEMRWAEDERRAVVAWERAHRGRR